MSMKSKRNKKSEPNTRIYLGPSIPGTGLERYKVLKGELHESINQLAKSVPAVKRLIVDTKEMANIERKLGDKTTVYAHSFAEIANHVKEVMKR